MKHRWPLVLALVYLCLLGRESTADPKPSPYGSIRSTAVAFFRAHQAKDEEAMETIAALRRFDPLLIASQILDQHAHATVAKSDRAAAFLAAAAAYAERVKARPDGEAVPAFVTDWEQLDTPALKREIEFRRNQVEIRKLPQERASRARAEALEAKAMEHPESFMALWVRYVCADLCVRLGDLDEAAERYESIAAEAETRGWVHIAAHAVWQACWMSERLGRWEALEGHARTRLQLLVLIERPGFAPRARIMLSVGLRGQGRFREALEQAEAGAQAAKELKDTYQYSLALASAGKARARMGEVDEGIVLLRQAAKLQQSIGKVVDAARTIEAESYVEGGRGRHARELELLEQAADVYARISDAEGQASIQERRGIVYRRIGRRDLALDAFEAALAYRRSRAASHPIELATALQFLAGAQTSLLNFEEAHTHLVESLALLRKTPRRTRLGLALSDMGQALVFLKRPAEGLAVLDEAILTLEKSTASDLTLMTRVRRATALSALDRKAEAEQELTRIAKARVAKSLPPEPALHTRLATLRLALGDGEGAARAARSAILGQQWLLQGFSQEEAVPIQSTVHRYANVGVDGAWLWQTSGPENARQATDAAFTLMESGRAAWLAQVLGTGEASLRGASPELHEREARSRRVLSDLQAELMKAAFGPAPEAERIAVLRKRIDAAYAERKQVLARVGRGSNGLTLERAGEGLRIADVQKLLGARTALVVFHMSVRGTYAIAIRKDRARFLRLAGSDEVATAAGNWLELLATPGATEAAPARKLHAMLIAPLREDLAGTDQLLIVPDGPLAFLPFGALRDEQDDNDRFLVASHEIAMLPSCGVLQALQERRASFSLDAGLVAIGDPIYPGEQGAPPPGPKTAALRGLLDLKRLPESGTEVKNLAALFPASDARVLLRGDATTELIETALAGADAIGALHLACHGYVDLHRPRLSGLVLTGGEVLSVDRIQNLRIRAELAVLSACDSARGRLLAGEGVIGLPRALFLAGVPRVVGTNWPVSDRSTRQFMARFYLAMLTKGLSPSAALRAVQLEQIKLDSAAGEPHRWAPFVFWGAP